MNFAWQEDLLLMTYGGFKMKQLSLPFDLSSEYEKLAKELTGWQYKVSNGCVCYPYDDLLEKIKEVGLNGWYVVENEGDSEWGCILWNGENLA